MSGCAYCGKKANTFECSGCSAPYCGEACQERAWEEKKDGCRSSRPDTLDDIAIAIISKLGRDDVRTSIERMPLSPEEKKRAYERIEEWQKTDWKTASDAFQLQLLTEDPRNKTFTFKEGTPGRIAALRKFSQDLGGRLTDSLGQVRAVVRVDDDGTIDLSG